MMRKWFAGISILAFMAALLAACAPMAFAQDQQASKTPYTLSEYNAFQTAAGQNDPQAKVQGLDDFVSKFPNSVLLPLAYKLYYATYNQLKNYPKTIEYVDKFLAVPDDKLLAIPGENKEAITGDRLQALYLRAVAFNQSFSDKDANAQDELTKARQSALDGLKVLDQIAKPANQTDDQFAQSKKPVILLFNYTAGIAAFNMKDYKDAIDSFNADVAATGSTTDQTTAATYYRLGVSYLQLAAQQAPAQSQASATPPAGAPPTTTPPGGTASTTPASGTATPGADSSALTDLYMNGFWDLARAVALNGSGKAQIQSYLRAEMFNYEQPACGTLLDAQLNELIQLAGTQATRPTTYSIPSAADLNKILQASNLLSILGDLQGGGDKAKMTWLAVCGQEIPSVVGKITDVTPGTDTIDFKVFTAATGEEIEAGTTPNLDVTVHTAPPAAAAGGQAPTDVPVQPEAARLVKNGEIKFTGTLVSYDAQPFLVHFDKCTVDPSVIPPEKGEKKPHRPGER
jgi:tetratricopeptide (TPR) repeat protein